MHTISFKKVLNFLKLVVFQCSILTVQFKKTKEKKHNVCKKIKICKFLE